MATRDHDELAEALKRLASGSEASSEAMPTAPPEGIVISNPSQSAGPIDRPSVPLGPRPIMPIMSPETAARGGGFAGAGRDDALSFTTPDLTTLLPKPGAAAKARLAPSAKPPLYQRLEFQRTTIPIMLTSGVLALIGGSLPFLSESDSPYRLVISPSFSIALYGTAIVMFGCAALTMASVKKQLRDKADSP